MEKVVLIGGSPTAGKSYTARKIAEKLKLPWISTDTIREQMREIVRKEDYPRLFFHSGADSNMALKYLSKNTAKEIVKNQNQESVDVWKATKAIIETDYVWGSFIIEGVAILPKLIKEFVSKNKKVVALFLIDEDIERIRKTIFTRGLWDDAKKYPDKVKEKEVEWVIAFNNYIKKEAKKHGYPVINVGDRNDYLKEIIDLIKE
jgi:2-phosphoglycerate kinase